MPLYLYAALLLTVVLSYTQTRHMWRRLCTFDALGRSQSEDEPFQAGPHTYASWNPREAQFAGRDFYLFEARGDTPSRYPRTTSLEARKPYRMPNPYYDEDGIEERYEDDLDEENYEKEDFMETNGIVDGLRKMYDALFFYGLEVPETRGRRRRVGNREKRRIQASRANKRNPFFTGSEAAAEEYFKGSADPNQVDRATGRSRRARGSRTPPAGLSAGEEDVGEEIKDGEGQPVERVLDQEPELESGQEFDVERGSIGAVGKAEEQEDVQARLDDIDVQLEMLEESLRRVDLSVVELKRRVADGGSSTGAAKDLPVLEEKRKQLEEAIEEAQIEYVDLQAALM